MKQGSDVSRKTPQLISFRHVEWVRVLFIEREPYRRASFGKEAGGFCDALSEVCEEHPNGNTE